jgi:hypothetical protein
MTTSQTGTSTTTPNIRHESMNPNAINRAGMGRIRANLRKDARLAEQESNCHDDQKGSFQI